MRILSWNIQWGRGSDGNVDIDRTASEIARVRADLVCLQEVAVNHPGLPGGAPGNQPEELAARLPGYQAIYAIGSDIGDGFGGRRQFGVLVLSRLPVLQVFRHLLPWPPDPAVPSMQRVALEAVVTAPWGAVRIATTHLEFYSATQRLAQVEALRDIHEQGWRQAVHPRSAAETDPPFAVLPRGEGMILYGDMNCLPGFAEHRRLLEDLPGGAPRLMDAWEIANPGAPHAPTAGLHPVGWLTEPGCYDFFFVSENLASRVRAVSVDGASVASDHQPVLLELAS